LHYRLSAGAGSRPNWDHHTSKGKNGSGHPTAIVSTEGCKGTDPDKSRSAVGERPDGPEDRDLCRLTLSPVSANSMFERYTEKARRVIFFARYGIKGAYERFHNVSYTDEAIAHAFVWANKNIRNKSLPGAAVDLIDAAGAAAQLEQASLPEEVAEVKKRIRFIVERMKASIANHEFEKARFYSQEERKDRDNLKQLREKYKLDNNPASKIGREEIERAVSKLIGNDSTSGTK